LIISYIGCSGKGCYQLLLDGVWMLCVSVVGEKEQQNGTVNIRTRDNKVHGEHNIAHVVQRFKHFMDDKVLDAEEKF